MQTRIIVHKAFNPHGVTNFLVEVGGQRFGFEGRTWRAETVHWFCQRSAATWLHMAFMYNNETLAQWKRRSRHDYGATRFERVTMLGDTPSFSAK